MTSHCITIPSHHINLHRHCITIPILTEVKGELTDAPQYRPALSIKESEKLLESLDDMTDAEVAAVLSKLKAAVSERIKSKSPCIALFCLALPCSALHCLVQPCIALFRIALPCSALHCLVLPSILLFLFLLASQYDFLYQICLSAYNIFSIAPLIILIS